MLEALRKQRLITGAKLAAILEVSLRTVYRDIEALALAGVPIRGEAGLGYALDPGYFLPPLNLAAEEIELLVLGARTVQRLSDPAMAAMAESALDKIRAVVPAGTLTTVRRDLIWTPPRRSRYGYEVDLFDLRRAAEMRKIVRVEYARRDGISATHEVRPLALTLLKRGWLLIGWCELSNRFHCFSLDRIKRTILTGRGFRDEEGKRLRDCRFFGSCG